MRITVDIPEQVLDDLLSLTGDTKRSPAVAKAVETYVRREKLREFGRLIRQGEFEDAFPVGYDPDQPTQWVAEEQAPYGQKSAPSPARPAAQPSAQPSAPQPPAPPAGPDADGSR